jgi:hypothetical protein
MLGPSTNQQYTRYKNPGGFSSARDPYQDLIVHLAFLGSADFVVDLLTGVHRVPSDEARLRAPTITAHARQAVNYLEQAETSRPEVCFLPCYYGLLQLAKIYILFSPLHGDLAANRHHGASYRPNGPPVDFGSDSISVGTYGTIWLFYKLLTGISLTKPVPIRMDQIYPYMSDVSTEWELAAPGPLPFILLHSEFTGVDGKNFVRWHVKGAAAKEDAPLSHLPVLRDCGPDPDWPGTFYRTNTSATFDNRDILLDGSIDRTYLYFPFTGKTISALMPGPLLMPEELPILMAFLHLSSVVRYHPDYLERLRDSRYWPVVLAARRHSMNKFLILLWSHLRQAHVSIGR